MILKFSVLFLALFSYGLAAEPEVDRPFDLTDLDNKKIVKKEKTLDYESLIEEMIKIKKQKNNFRSELDLRALANEVIGKRFLMKDTVTVKRNALVSRDYVLWFEPFPGIESKLTMDDASKEAFEKINELDHITVFARLEKVDQYMHFKFIELKNIKPFNPKANFVDFNQVLEKSVLEKKKSEVLSFDTYLSNIMVENKHKIGHITGKVEKFVSIKGKYYMTMQVHGLDVNIECIPEYIHVLAELNVGSKATMAVYLMKVDEKKALFGRGVLINLKK